MTDGLRSIIALSGESLRDIVPAEVGKEKPKFEWVDPRTLFVEESYQRAMASNSIKLIRKIVGGWSWARFKAPVCVRLPAFGNVLVCIDGQHTATSAASHPEIDKIPVMIVPASSVTERAAAFVGQNRDRLSLTQIAIYRAEVVAGDATVMVMERALAKAGLAVPVAQQSYREYKPGQTVAIGTIKALAKQGDEPFLVRVLSIVAAAKRAPARADEIAAVALLLRASPGIKDSALTAIIASKDPTAWVASARAGAASTLSIQTALAEAWGRALKVDTTKVKQLKSHKASAAVAPERKGAAQPEPKKEPVGQLATPVGQPAPSVAHANGAPAANVVARNGIQLDLETGELTNRGHNINVGCKEGMWLVAALLRVMPSMLEFSRLERSVYGRAAVDGSGTIRALADHMNGILANASLEIKVVPKMGCTLFDPEYRG